MTKKISLIYFTNFAFIKTSGLLNRFLFLQPVKKRFINKLIETYQMNRLIVFLSVLLVLAACKGPGSGPLVKDSLDKNSRNDSENQNPHMNPHGMNTQSQGSKVAVEKIDVKIDPCKDCIKISDLLENKKTYSGKTIKVTGKVTKFNPEIMGKNWIHIQDGSEFQGGFDLTITTDQKVAVGDIITLEGKIVLDKDFGYGYFYNVLMEDAKPVI
jgi:hypothetical protein